VLTDARGKPRGERAATIDDVGHHEGRVLRIIVAQWEDQPGGISGIRFVGRIDLLPYPCQPGGRYGRNSLPYTFLSYYEMVI